MIGQRNKIMTHDKINEDWHVYTATALSIPGLVAMFAFCVVYEELAKSWIVGGLANLLLIVWFLLSYWIGGIVGANASRIILFFSSHNAWNDTTTKTMFNCLITGIVTIIWIAFWGLMFWICVGVVVSMYPGFPR
jgi:hypothetical protein